MQNNFIAQTSCVVPRSRGIFFFCTPSYGSTNYEVLKMTVYSSNGFRISKNGNIYNWKPSINTHELPLIETHSGFKLTNDPLPTAVDLRNFCSPIENQGQIGSCTGHALVGAMEFLENKLKIDETNNSFSRLSRLFVYYNERAMEGDVGQDNGAQIADGVTILASKGICNESIWPYVPDNFAIAPPDTAFQDALLRKISAYARVSQDIQSIKTALASGYPIVFGFTVFSGFESEETAHTGILNMPGPTEENLGGHAVLCVGYDDATQRVLVRNSWGADWGMNGYFTMPYQYMSDPSMASDFWVINR